MSDEVTIEIDGRPLKARKGQMLIEVADAHGIRIPRFCYHPKLSVAANCRMCLVEVEKAPKALPACATPVADGMKVYTRSPKALAAQKATMEFLLINHPLDCPICDQGGECELQDLALGYGRDVSRFAERKRVVADPDLGPLVATDMTRCIHCTRCVRFGEEIAGVKELGAVGRGEHMRITTYVPHPLRSELSGNVIDLCPVGALTSKPFRFRARPWELIQHEGVAPHDAVGSNIHIHTLRGRVMRVVPHDNEEVNETWLSDRDRFSYEGLYGPDRLERPLLREGGVLQEADWELALERAAARLREVVAAHGPDAVGVLVSPSATVEELYLAQKLARGLGSGNVDHRLRQGDFGADPAMGRAPGLGMRIPELERVDAALLVGSDIRMDQPLLGLRLRKAGMRGAEIAVLNPVDYEFYFPVAHRLITDPPGMVRALAAIAADLVRHSDIAVPPAVAGLVEGARVEEAHAAVAHTLRRAGRGLVVLGAQAHASPWFGALRLLAGYVAAASGAALAELPFGANAAGAWLAGAVPHRGPGGAPAQPAGLDARAMLERPRRAYVLLGVEPERDAWNPAAAARALGEAELVIQIAPWLSEAGRRWAHVALPAAAFAETSGTFVNADGRWQSFEGAARPPGEARPAWKILRVLGTLLDLEGFGYEDPDEIRREVRAAVEAAPDPAGTVAAVALPETAASLWRVGDVPIYAVDPLVRRSRPLQETPLAVEAALRVAPATAARLGLAAGARVRVRQDGTQAELEVVLDRRVAEGCALVHAGVPGSEGLGPAVGPLEIVAG